MKTARLLLLLVVSLAVACASLVVSGRLAGIWNVGTLPEYRRRGISAEMMHTLVSDAASHGYVRADDAMWRDHLPVSHQQIKGRHFNEPAVRVTNSAGDAMVLCISGLR